MSGSSAHLYRNPKVLILALLQFFVMAGYSTQISSLEIFLTQTMHFHTARAFATLAMFLSPMLVLPVISGYIGDRFLGHYRTILLGLLLEFLGFLLFALNPEHYLFWSLALIQCGINLGMPNMFVLVGRQMPKLGALRDSGFMINYAGINLGATLSIFASGYIVDAGGYSMLCWYSTAIVVITFILFLIFKRNIITEDETKPIHSLIVTLVLSGLAVAISHTLLLSAERTNVILIAAGIVGLAIIAYLAIKNKNHYRQKLFTYLSLSIICSVFIAFYYLTPNLILNFIDTNAEHRLFGFFIPTQSLYVFSPIFVIIFALLISEFWVFLKNRNISIKIPGKICLGLFFLALSYVLLFLATTFPNKHAVSAIGWIIAFFALQSLGEICVIPLGFAMVGILSPKQSEGLLQGVWALTMGLAIGISSFIARASAYSHRLTPHMTTPLYAHTFWIYAVILAGVGILTLALIPKLTKAFVVDDQAS